MMFFQNPVRKETSELTNKENYGSIDVTDCTSYNAIALGMYEGRTNLAFGYAGTQAPNTNLHNLLDLPSSLSNLAYVGAAITAVGVINTKPVLQVFVYEQTSASYGARMRWVYPIGDNYIALNWLTVT